jgi:hypothetical protein
VFKDQDAIKRWQSSIAHLDEGSFAGTTVTDYVISPPANIDTIVGAFDGSEKRVM